MIEFLNKKPRPTEAERSEISRLCNASRPTVMIKVGQTGSSSARIGLPSVR